jgi:hypothetical protein
MPSRAITIEGRRWDVTHTGRITANDRDEFGLLFVSGSGPDREVRVTRYSPQGARWRDQSLAELSEEDLQRYFSYSQPSFTSPEAGYRP